MASMTAEQAAEAGRNLDFDKVWAALLKTDEQIEKMSKLARTAKDHFSFYIQLPPSGLMGPVRLLA